MSVEDLIAQVSEQIAAEPTKVEKAVGILLHLVKSEGDSSLVPEFMTALPGADELADRHADGSGELLGAMEGAMGGGTMAAFIRLWKVGLTPQQIRTVGERLFGHVIEKKDEPFVRKVLASIPGMEQHL